MITNVASALTITYQHHNEQFPPTPRYRRVQRIAIQNDSPLEPWSCGTIAILTTLHLTLGNTRPDRIPANSITRQQMLNLHQALLQWLIIAPPPIYGTYNASTLTLSQYHLSKFLNITHMTAFYKQNPSPGDHHSPPHTNNPNTTQPTPPTHPPPRQHQQPLTTSLHFSNTHNTSLPLLRHKKTRHKTNSRTSQQRSLLQTTPN